MKISRVVLAGLLASVATPVGAVGLSPGGIGQVLLFPYYTVNAGQDTLVTLVSTSDNSQVVKVRLLEGYNGRPVLDFDLYLRAHDAWTASISLGEGNRAVLRTGDRSCTVPAIPAAGIPLTTALFDGTGALPADAGPHDVSRTHEGSLEVISGASIRLGSDTELALQYEQPRCDQLPGSLLTDIDAPGRNLYGTAAVINVSQGLYYAYDAEALSDFSRDPLYTPTMGAFEPSLANVGGAAAGADAFVLGSEGTTGMLHFERKIDAVSAVLAKQAVTNQYIASASLGAKTDWIVTFPTQRYYTDPAISGSNAAISPFEEVFHAPGVSRVDITYTPAIYDRESSQCANTACLYGSPFHLDHAVNAITFAQPADATGPSGVFVSELPAYLYPYADSGHASIPLPGNVDRGVDHGPEGLGPVYLYGLPTIGFMAYNLVNANAQPGRLANYGGIYRHRFDGVHVCPQSKFLHCL